MTPADASEIPETLFKEFLYNLAKPLPEGIKIHSWRKSDLASTGIINILAL